MPVLTSHPGSRIQMLDVIQGLALLGLLLVNSKTYSLFAWLSPNQVYHAHLDRPATYIPLRFFMHFLVQGPVYPLISLLFGLAFYRCWHTLRQKAVDANRVIIRGLCVLFVVGIIHAFGFWFGDLLHQYALIGFTLLYFIRQSTKTVIQWALGLLGVVILISIFKSTPFLATAYPFSVNLARLDLTPMKVTDVWQQGSYIEVLQEQIPLFRMRYGSIFQQYMSPLLYQELLVLLGLIAGKSSLLESLDQFRLQLSLLLLVIFPLAMLLNGLNTLLALGMFAWPVDLPGDQMQILNVTYLLGAPLLALIYVFEISLYTRKYLQDWTVWVGQVGQMGLTNYLMQTILCMICFYGYGLGLGGRLTLLKSLVVVTAIYAFQLIFSHLWLSRHDQGPVEWLWAKLAHGRPAKTLNSTLHPLTENGKTLP